MSKELIYAYVAGLIDGEGTIALGYKHKTSLYRFPNVSVPSCSPELLTALKQQFGGYISDKRRSKAHHTPSQVWRIDGDRALLLLKNVLPYLREPEKRRRAELLIDNYKRLTPRNGKYTDEQRLEKLEFEHLFFEGSTSHRQTARIRWAAAA